VIVISVLKTVSTSELDKVIKILIEAVNEVNENTLLVLTGKNGAHETLLNLQQTASL